MRPTIRDVAKLAGVSAKTVSRTINDESTVRPQTKEKVRSAIQELKFHPDLSARDLRGNTSYSIGLVYANPNANYVISLQTGTLKRCREVGYGLQIFPLDTSDIDVEMLTNLLSKSRLAGLVLAPPMSESHELRESLNQLGIPFVGIISNTTEEALSANTVEKFVDIILEDEDAAFEITEHMISIGHRKIAFLPGDTLHGSTRARLRGYRSCLQSFGFDAQAELIPEGDYSFSSGFKRAGTLLAMSNPPTAIIGCNDEIACGAQMAIISQGVRVPSDVSIAGFEDSPFSKYTYPHITTAHQPTKGLGHMAASELLKLIRPTNDHRASLKRAIRLKPELIIRGSTAVRPRR